MGAEAEVKTPPTVDTDEKYDLDHLNAGEGAPTAQPEPEAAAEPAKAAAPPAPQHDPHLVALAKDLGFTDEQIQTIPPAQLSQSVTYWTRLRLQEEREQRERARQQPIAPPPAAPTPAAEEEEDLSEVHPAIRKRLEKQQKELESLRPMKERLEQQAKMEQYRQSLAVDAAVDGAIEELPAKIRKVLGTGEGKLLAKDSAELRRRLLLFQQAGIDPRVETEAVMKRKYKKAAMDIYGDVIPDEAAAKPGAAAAAEDAGDTEADETAPPPVDLAKKNGKSTKGEWDESGLATPTGRKSPPRKGDDAAVEAMRAWKLRNGHTPKNDQRPADLEGVE